MADNKSQKALDKIADTLQGMATMAGTGVGLATGNSVAGTAAGAAIGNTVGRIVTAPMKYVSSKLEEQTDNQEKDNSTDVKAKAKEMEYLKKIGDGIFKMREGLNNAIGNTGTLVGAGIGFASGGTVMSTAIGGMIGKGFELLAAEGKKGLDKVKEKRETAVVQEQVEEKQEEKQTAEAVDTKAVEQRDEIIKALVEGMPNKEERDEKHRDIIQAMQAQGMADGTENIKEPKKGIFSKIFSGLLAGLGTGVGLLKTGIMGIITPIMTGLKMLLGGIGKFAAFVFKGFTSLLKRIPLITAAIGIFGGITDAIQGFKDNLAAGGDLFSASLTGVKDFAAGFFETIFGGLADVLDWLTGGVFGIRDKFDGLTGWFKEKIDEVGNFISDKLTMLGITVPEGFDDFDPNAVMTPTQMIANEIKRTGNQIDADTVAEQYENAGIIDRNIFGDSDITDFNKLKQLSAAEIAKIASLGDWSQADLDKMISIIQEKRNPLSTGSVSVGSEIPTMNDIMKKNMSKGNKGYRYNDDSQLVANNVVTNVNQVSSQTVTKGFSGAPASAANRNLSGSLEKRTAQSY